MKYSFSSSHNGKVIETKWIGALTGEIIKKGVIDRETWIENNTKCTPLVLLSNYAEADLKKTTSEELRLVRSQFREIKNKYPEAHWISIMPADLRYGIAGMWQVFADKVFTNTHVAGSRDEAERLISSIIEGQ